MRIFVTGGAGFVGTNLVRHLAHHTDDEITVFDALTYAGDRRNLDGIVDQKRVRFVLGDVTDRSAVAEAMAGHDAVVHAAAESHVDRSIASAAAFVGTNCGGTEVVCDVAVSLRVDRFLHVSTDEVYGPIEVGSFGEDAPLRPRSPYAASKAGSDLIALACAETHGLPVVVARSTNQYGPHQFPEKLIPRFTTALLQGRSVPLYGDGLQERDWLHVEDGCRALDLLLRQGAVGQIYNVGTGDHRTNLSVTAQLLDLVGCDPTHIEHVADRPGHDRRYGVDTTKVRALGWTPRRSFDQALAETVRWYRQHPGWWGPKVERAVSR